MKTNRGRGTRDEQINAGNEIHGKLEKYSREIKAINDEIAGAKYSQHRLIYLVGRRRQLRAKIKSIVALQTTAY